MLRPTFRLAAGLALLALLPMLTLALPLAPQPVARAQGSAAPPSAASAAATLAATRKLSLITATDGFVLGVKVAGDHVVYLVNYNVAERFDLYSAPIAGGAPVHLTANMPLGDIEAFDVTAGGLVVFSARRDSTGQRFLYSVPVAGGALTLLGPTYPAQQAPGLPPGSDLDFVLAGDRVVFRVDVARYNGFELFSVPAAGGPATRISQALPPSSITSLPAPFWAGAFAASANGQQVVYQIAGSIFGQGNSLYSVPVAGGTPVLLGADPVLRGDAFAISPDGARVIYRTDTELRSVGIDGGAPALIETTPALSFLPFALTSDSARVVYALSDITGTIKSAPVTGGDATIVAADARYAGSQTFRLTPDGAEVLYNDGALTSLLRAPVTGGISQTVIVAPVGPTGVEFTEDGARALFVAGNVGAQALYSYPLAGGTPTRIDDPAVSAGGSLFFDGIVAGGRVIYAASTSQGGPFRLYSVPLAGGATTALTGDLGERQELLFVRGAAANGTVIFTSGSRFSSSPLRWYRLYAVPADGSVPARLVDTPRAIVGDVTDFAASPADERAVYIADQERDGVPELYSVPLAGGTPTRLNTAGQTVASFKLSPAGGRVVYLAGMGGQAANTLYSVPIGGGEPALVGAPIHSGQVVSGYDFTADGARVVYQAGPAGTPPAQTLFSAPATGGAAVTIGENVARFAIDPTGARVAFAADIPLQLKSAPVAGGTVATLGGLVESSPLLFTPDGARVIYEAGGVLGTSAVVSQPLVGGDAVPLVPTDSLLENRSLQLSADGAALLYGGQLRRVDLNDPLLFRILRVPVAGGAAVTVVEQSLPASSQAALLRFAQAPGGGPVIFNLSRLGPSSTIEQRLASVPLTGGAPTTLYGPANITTTPLLYRLSADGSQVLFLAEGGVYRVPAAGGSAPVKLSSAGFVLEFAFADDGAALFIEGGRLYRAPVAGAAVRLDALPEGVAAVRFLPAGRSVVFSGLRDATGIPGSGTTELYAADLPASVPPEARFSAERVSVREGAGQTGVEVRLASTATTTVTLSYSVTGGTAVAGVDYSLEAGPLTFAPGETVKSLPLRILDRPGFSGSRVLVVTLGLPELAQTPPTSSGTVVITITDDEYGVFLPLVRR